MCVSQLEIQILFELMSAKDENIKVAVHSVLATKYHQASKEFKVISNQITFSR